MENVGEELRSAHRPASLVGIAIIVSLFLYLVVVEVLRATMGPFRGFVALPGDRDPPLRLSTASPSIEVLATRFLQGLLLRRAPGDDARATILKLARTAIVTLTPERGPGPSRPRPLPPRRAEQGFLRPARGLRWSWSSCISRASGAGRTGSRGRPERHAAEGPGRGPSGHGLELRRRGRRGHGPGRLRPLPGAAVPLPELGPVPGPARPDRPRPPDPRPPRPLRPPPAPRPAGILRAHPDDPGHGRPPAHRARRRRPHPGGGRGLQEEAAREGREARAPRRDPPVHDGRRRKDPAARRDRSLRPDPEASRAAFPSSSTTRATSWDRP